METQVTDGLRIQVAVGLQNAVAIARSGEIRSVLETDGGNGALRETVRQSDNDSFEQYLGCTMDDLDGLPKSISSSLTRAAGSGRFLRTSRAVTVNVNSAGKMNRRMMSSPTKPAASA